MSKNAIKIVGFSVLCFILGLGVAYTVFSYQLEKGLENCRAMTQLGNNLRTMNVSSTGQVSVFVPTTSFEKGAEISVNAVVSITTSSRGGGMFDMDEILGGQGRGAGSGVIISPDGYIITNHHVIDGAKKITVILNNKNEYEGKVLAYDKNTDLAVVKIEATGLPVLKFGNSDDVHIGQWVLAVGNPFSLNSTVTAGIVSAKARNIGILRKMSESQDYSIESFIQTDAAVNPGNSGGALVSLNGDLIGINTAIATETGSFAGYSFAIPSNLVRKVIADLIQYGSVQRGFIGVSIQNVDAKIARKYNLPNGQGAYIAALTPNGAARHAGLKEGDIITKVNGRPVASSSELQEQVAMFSPGDKITVSVLRDGVPATFTVELRNQYGEVKKETPIRRPENESENEDWGALFSTPDSEELSRLELAYGIKVEQVREGGIFDEIGLQPGFIITKINRQPIKSLPDLTQALNLQSGSLLLEGYTTNGRKGVFNYQH